MAPPEQRPHFFTQNFRIDFRRLLREALATAKDMEMEGLFPLRIVLNEGRGGPPESTFLPYLSENKKVFADNVASINQQFKKRKVRDEEILELVRRYSSERPSPLNITAAMIGRTSKVLAVHDLKDIARSAKSEEEAAMGFVFTYDVACGVSFAQRRVLLAEAYKNGNIDARLRLLIPSAVDAVELVNRSLGRGSTSLNMAEQTELFLFMHSQTRNDALLLSSSPPEPSGVTLIREIANMPPSEVSKSVSKLLHPVLVGAGTQVFRDLYERFYPFGQEIFSKLKQS